MDAQLLRGNFMNFGYFDSFQAFLQMGGHAFYVWLSYAVTVTVLVLNIAAPLIRYRRLRRVALRRPAGTAATVTAQSSSPAHSIELAPTPAKGQ